ncbi:DUF6789 family protein [Nitrosopumilus sp.]|uniref:DUF6789 family protein n=1 Tax=Nitrosopumilus sp. TaxID=2024843 RepID=UPI00292F9266|nr:DUF6789 family protein [Nitrosopumilus sp.]
MQHNRQLDVKNDTFSFPISKGRIEGLVLVGLVATGAFDLVMYADMAITGIPLEIPNVLGGLVLGDDHQYVEPVGRLIHLGNGIGLALLFGFVALPISKKLVKLPTIVYGIAFAAVELVVAVWLGMLPALGAGLAGLNIGPEVPIVTLLRHIAFGAVLGISVRRWNH